MKLRLPDSYVLIFVIIVLLGVSSYFIPSGSFDRYVDAESGITYVIPESYRIIEKNYISLFDFVKAIPEGMMQASNIIIFVLLTGGSFGIINATGTINTAVNKIVQMYGKKEKRLIPIIMILFSLAGAVFGTAEEALPLYPIFIALSLALGFDRITGVALVLLGTGAGFVAGFLNPFTVGIAQEISELPLFSGIGFRIVAYFVFVITAIIYVYLHASKIKKEDHEPITIYGDAVETGFDFDRLPTLTKKHVRVIFVLLISFAFLTYGIIRLKFYILEISTTFLIMGILSGLVGELKPGRIVAEFTKGASSLIYGALIIGLARGVTAIMEYADIMDTVIYNLSIVIKDFSPRISSIGMFFIQSIINLFVTSGSGQASVTMPIMKSIADIVGISRQTAVLAFQFGDGFSNVISPTSGYFMAALALGGIKWREWAKWMAPLFIIWCIQGSILLIISTYVY
ncbi:MAG: AbgT family transporter [Dethiosulfatibacter sp.]|nr:AbgT family transporter [Dethiosulfatibacter sp.]